jgi:hypothetical protein
MYVTGPNQVHALRCARRPHDLEIRAAAVPRNGKGDPAKGTNRGVAVLGDRVFVVDGQRRHLLALHRVTGALLWESVITEGVTDKTNIGNTAAPLIVNDLVVAGVSGGDLGMRGFLDAYKASTRRTGLAFSGRFRSRANRGRRPGRAPRSASSAGAARRG